MKFLIVGPIEIDMFIKVKKFPIEYCSVDYNFFGIDSMVAGHGMNISKAIKKLGGQPVLLSIIGQDMYEPIIMSELNKNNIDFSNISTNLRSNIKSVVLYNNKFERQIILDLVDIQEKKYCLEDKTNVINECDIVVMSNINFGREILREAKLASKVIATDIHEQDDINDSYNKEFIELSDILFISNNKIVGNEKEFLEQLIEKYKNEIIVIKMGDKGALLYVRKDNMIKRYKSISAAKLNCALGAGDSLFSAFVFFYCKYKNPYRAIEKAMVFSAYKIRKFGPNEGFVDEQIINQYKNMGEMSCEENE